MLTVNQLFSEETSGSRTRACALACALYLFILYYNTLTSFIL